ncbi:MAG: response regulator [Gammaproteobacteria bacterium SHHR-1]|uniref:response regulator n=1 Tax=Magnetovirga frankeli TaxID=947516 RepID=UPI001293737F|nr:response regulator [gamma proteobacterium SS-5]
MAHILIIDDSPTEQYVLRTALEGAGYSVSSANDGEAGIKLANETLPDLILMDVVMPNMNGFQATRKLSRQPQTADIPIIMVTTKDQETDKTWAKRQGARDYMVKPVNKAELLSKIKDILG